MIGPFDHPWLGAVFGDADALKIWSPERQIEHILAFEAEYTRALGATGAVSATTAESIAHAIKTFQPELDELSTGAKRDGLIVPALVKQLKAISGDHADCIHNGATSQDVIDTALALTLKEFNTLLDARLVALSSAFKDLSTKFGTHKIMGRTRMQAALPITVGHRVRTWSRPIEKHRIRLENLRPSVEVLQLGGPVGDGATMAPHTAEISAIVAQALDLRPPEFAWHSTRDTVADYANILSLITGSLGKFGQDICLMAQQGIDEVALRGGGGSSAMPHKQNPILAELLVTLAQFNATQLSGMHAALVHEQERSGSAWALEWMILPQMAQATARSLSASKEICHAITMLGSV